MDKEKAQVQDLSREVQMIRMLGLKDMKNRMGHDAEDDQGRKFELKSTTKSGFATARDVSVNMIAKWRKLHWVFAKGTNYADGFEIESMYLCTADMMKEQFDIMEKKFEPDITIQNAVLTHVKSLLTTMQLNRLAYLIERGMTYNNPHIGVKYVESHGVRIDLKRPAPSLKELLTEHLDT